MNISAELNSYVTSDGTSAIQLVFVDGSRARWIIPGRVQALQGTSEAQDGG